MSTVTEEIGSAFRWTKEYEVGIERFDTQHKKLFTIIDVLGSALAQGEGSAVVEPVLADLIALTKQHFQDEESFMAKYSFPSLPEHRTEHETFLKQIHKFREAHEQGRVAVPAQLLLFMQRWWSSHVQTADQKYGAFLTSRGVH